MTTIKKVWKFISSMRFAIILLVILALACALSSTITQGQSYAWYAQRYSQRAAAAIVALGLDDAFHSAWFMLIAGFLCLNLLLCNVLRLPQLIRRTREAKSPEQALKLSPTARVEGVSDAEAAFKRLRLGAPVRFTDGEGREALFAAKNRAGHWGAWVCHLGILLLILGFGLGQMTQRQYTVYGVPGQSRAIGDTGYLLGIDRFEVGLREDDTVQQYTADITVYDMHSGGEDHQSATISVNHPAKLCGMKFYQNSTGWAATVDVSLSGEPLQQEILCVGEYFYVADNPELAIALNAFYPDYQLVPGVGPTTLSDRLNNPAYLYTVYFQGRVLGMNALMEGEELTIDDYTVTFSQPQRYTLIQIKRDRFTWLALLGGLVTLAGLALALYVQPTRVWATREADGGWTLCGHCPKGGAIFRERFEQAAKPALREKP